MLTSSLQNTISFEKQGVTLEFFIPPLYFSRCRDITHAFCKGFEFALAETIPHLKSSFRERHFSAI